MAARRSSYSIKPGWYKRYTAFAVDQDQGRRRARPVISEVGLADRYRDALQSGIVVLPNLPNVSDLILGLRILSLGRVSVELRGSENRQSLSERTPS